MRLFAAAEIGEALAAQVAELIQELQTRVTDAAPAARVTWIPSDRLHITVRFIGEVPDDRVDAIRTALDVPINVESTELTLKGAGAFPNSGAPRVIWAGVGQGRGMLIAAEREVSARLARIAVAGEERGYSPHVTLARVREAGGLRSPRLLDGLEDRVIGTARIDAITLFQSRLSPKGPAYVPLLRTALRC